MWPFVFSPPWVRLLPLPVNLCDVEDLTRVAIRREDELSHRVDLQLKDPDKENIVLSLEDRDADELVLVLQGYYKLLTERELPVEQEKSKWPEDAAPPYHNKHRVQGEDWSYPPKLENGAPQTESHERSDEYYVDLSTAPPYHHPSERYKIPNGHVPSIERRDEFEQDPNMAAAVTTGTYAVDKNMNKTLEDNANLSPMRHFNHVTGSESGNNNNSAADSDYKKQTDSKDVDPGFSSQTLGFDMQSVVSMEILEEEGASARPGSDEVVKRVADMKQMVEDAQQYLTEEADDLDVASEKIILRTEQQEMASTYGQLKHSDSLEILLTQGPKSPTKTVNGKIKDLEIIDNEHSESDSDSQSTPANSPSRRQEKGSNCVRPTTMLKPSDSSFGLHSPDSLPAGFSPLDQDVQELLKRLKEDNTLPYNFAEGTLYLDPDIIDLTMIPPPITPDEEGAKLLPSQLSTPPTPFADRQSLEAELKSLQTNPGLLQDMMNQDPHTDGFSETSSSTQNEDNSSYSSTVVGNLTDADDTSSLNSLNMSGSSTDSVFRSSEPTAPSDSSVATFRELRVQRYLPECASSYLDLELGNDLDSLIANLTIPPPPDVMRHDDILQFFPEHSPVVELTQDDISAFIIPPPPSWTGHEGDSSDMIQRLYQAAEGIKEVVENSSGGQHRGSAPEYDEVTWPTYHKEKLRSAPRFSSRKTRFNDGEVGEAHLLSLDEDPIQKQNSVSESSACDNENSNVSVVYQTDEQALDDEKPFLRQDENDMDLRSRKPLQLQRSQSSVSPKTQLQEKGHAAYMAVRHTHLQRQLTHPSARTEHFPLIHVKSLPLSSVSAPREFPISGASSRNIARSNSSADGRRPGRGIPLPKRNRQTSASTGSLPKSASQSDLMANTNARTILKSPSKVSGINKIYSLSSDDLPTNLKSPSSQFSSKYSITSSDDSLNSNTSVTTVKPLIGYSSGNEVEKLSPKCQWDAGSLQQPTPSSPTKSGMKPPLPPSSPQESLRATVHKGLKSPSHSQANGPSTSPKGPEINSEISQRPDVPSRLKKPQTVNLKSVPAPYNLRNIPDSASRNVSNNKTVTSQFHTSSGISFNSSKPGNGVKANSDVNPSALVVSTSNCKTAPSSSPQSSPKNVPLKQSESKFPNKISRVNQKSDSANGRKEESSIQQSKTGTNRERTNGIGRKVSPPAVSKGSPGKISAPSSKLESTLNSNSSPMVTPKLSTKLPRPNAIGATVQSVNEDTSVNKEKMDVCPPLRTSSPKTVKRSTSQYDDNRQLTNGVGNHNGILNKSFDVNSFDQEFLDSSLSYDKEQKIDIDVLTKLGKEILFKKSEEKMKNVLLHLEEVISQCSAAHITGGGPQMDEEKFQIAKEMLTLEARQFVTASKLFVKSVAESETQLLKCLCQCIRMIEKITTISEDVASYTFTPLQTQNLVIKVKDVAQAYLYTIQASSMAFGKEIQDPRMNQLMEKATALANVLTTLMRTLRVFAP